MPDTGNIRVSIFGGDRQPWTGDSVTLKLVDPFSQKKKILVDHDTQPGVNDVVLEKAPADSGQNYAILATTGGHRDAGIYPVKPLPGQEVSAAVMLVRNRPAVNLSGFSFGALQNTSPRFHQAMVNAGITEAEFLALKPERIAGALNVEAKLRKTMLAGTPAVDRVARIGGPGNEGTAALNQDRIFASVDPTMPDLVRQEGNAFLELLEFENELFHAGYPVSFKQRVSFGSLQLSFAKQPGDNNLLAADIDIDLFTDIGHFGEVIKNHITKTKTDPFTVYRLLFDQGIAPLYTLATAAAAAARAG